jgi:hypothetical protein
VLVPRSRRSKPARFSAVSVRTTDVVLLPVAAAALLVELKLAADRGTDRAAPVDGRGAVLMILALGALSYGLAAFEEGNRVRESIAIAAAVPATWLFIRSEARFPAPMLPLSLFRSHAKRNPSFNVKPRAAVIVVFCERIQWIANCSIGG